MTASSWLTYKHTKHYIDYGQSWLLYKGQRKDKVVEAVDTSFTSFSEMYELYKTYMHKGEMHLLVMVGTQIYTLQSHYTDISPFKLDTWQPIE